MPGTPHGLLIAGTGSGVGKTTVTLGLLGALHRKGLAVAPFKAGPDFIDPGLHRLAAGRESRNLDTWMMSPRALGEAFARGCAGADLALVEGVMGLFDGARGGAEAGTTAHLARRLGLPVVLVVDARGMAGSAAAVVHGFASLDRRVRVAGVILNRVAGAGHLAYLVEAIERRARVPVLGHLPREEELAIPERHLGLTTAEDLAAPEVLAQIADRVASGVDLERLTALAVPCRLPPLPTAPPPAPRARLGVARDAAFCFLYPDTLERLAEAGVEAVPFSPLADRALPDGVDGLYLPGGYPEVHGAALAANGAMRAAVRTACGAGMPVYAECGGLVYLSEGVTDADGRFHPMCGVLPARCRLGNRRAALGYREVTVSAPGPLGAAGTRLKGHEFRYSEIDAAALARAGVERTLTLARRGGGDPRPEGYRVGRTWATYAHVVLTRRAARAWAAELARHRREGPPAAARAAPSGGSQGVHPVC
jgi:cobyrinic acid a,c-diamide synthase